ncbi:MAG: AI-2E family transporter [Gemmatimonadota bacterium]
MAASRSKEGDAQRDRFGRWFVLLLTVGITILFLAMIRSMILALLLAGIFAGMLWGVFQWLMRLFGGRRRLAALLTVLLLLLLVVVPLSAFLGVVAAQALDVTASVGPWIERQMAQPDPLGRVFTEVPILRRLEPYQEQVIAKAGELTGRLGEFLVGQVAALTRGTATFLLQLFVMLYAMFFFLLSGRELLGRILHYMPLEADDESLMVEKFVSVTRATIKGSLVIGILQGALAGGAFAVAGIQGAAFWGTVMAVLSIIPAVGSGLVWVPAVIYLSVIGRPGAAIGLGLWCLAVVGSVDNFLRPMLVGRDTKMPDLLVLVSTLGGLFLFGAVGFIIGPVVAALFVAVWEIYGRVFRTWLPAEPDPAVAGELAGPSAAAAEAGDGPVSS